MHLKNRTKKFALDIMKMTDLLPPSTAGLVIARQIIRSATSVGANYRAASRAKSNADFINKMKIVEEEVDETSYWLELIVEGELLEKEKVANLINESNQITAMTVASIKTARKKQ